MVGSAMAWQVGVRQSAKRLRLSNVRMTAGLLMGPHVWAMETGAYVPSREPGLGTEVAVPTDQRAASTCTQFVTTSSRDFVHCKFPACQFLQENYGISCREREAQFYLRRSFQWLWGHFQ